jgi:asparagine synthase (glutamine-hydrolysing)
MCGFVGMFHPQQLPGNVRDKDAFRAMLWSLDNRGPDEKSMLCHPTIWLGHARLSIIDIATGQQPMGWEEEGVYVVYNGEIFNYIELRKELMAQGVTFKTQSDTEVLIRLYQKYGIGMLSYLNGQFSFCIWDKKQNSVFLARDQFGILPLYYTVQNDVLYFASTIKALLQHPQIMPELNLAAMNGLTRFWVPLEQQTFFKNIHMLRPGEYMQCSTAGVVTQKYWDLSFTPPPAKTENEWQEEVHVTLSDAVKRRLRADVPVGSYLSGGLDSSIICALINEHHGGVYNSYSVQFSEKDYDESHFQRRVTETLNVNHHAITVTPEKIAHAYRDMVLHAEQPVFRTAPTPLLMLSETVRESGLKVVLTGEGADEIAWGYDIFKETAIRHLIHQGADEAVWREQIVNLYPYLKHFNPRYAALMMSFYKKHSQNPKDPLFSHLTRWEAGGHIQQYFADEVRHDIAKTDVREMVEHSLPEAFGQFSPLQQCQYLEMKTLLSGYLLSSQGDRMSMGHSVEARYPFLDIEVVNLFASMPDALKLRGMNEKYILKQSFKHMLPEEIIQRPKQPYRAPESLSLLQGGLIEEYLSAEKLRQTGLFHPDLVDKLTQKLRDANTRQHFSFNDNLAFNIVLSTQIFFDLFLKQVRTTAIPANAHIHEIAC